VVIIIKFIELILIIIDYLKNLKYP